MKKYFYIALTAVIGLSTASLTSCSDGGDDKPIADEITAVKLTASKTTVEANNEDVAVLTMTDQNGNDISEVATVHLWDVATNTVIKDPNIKMYANEELSIELRYGNKALKSAVTIKGVNREKYEKYYRYVGVYQLTGTWCQNCPSMTEKLEKIDNEYLPDRIMHLTFHTSSGQGTDPFNIEETGTLNSMFGLNGGYPGCVIDMRAGLSNVSWTTIAKAIRESMANYPATCGIKMATSLDGVNLTITPEVAFEKEGNYSFGYAILADGLKATQSGAPSDKEYLHNNTVRGISGISGGAIGTQQAGGTYTNTFKATLPEDIPAKDMRVAAFVLKETADKKWYINNMAVCSVENGSVDYKLNK